MHFGAERRNSGVIEEETTLAEYLDAAGTGKHVCMYIQRSFSETVYAQERKRACQGSVQIYIHSHALRVQLNPP